MFKNILKILGFFGGGIIGGIFANLIIWPYLISGSFLGQSPQVYVTERKEITIQENTALKDAAEKAVKALIGIKTETAGAEILEGTGLVVTSDGLMVTLAELIPQGSDFAFFAGQEAVSYQILKRDSAENLALVKIGRTNLSALSFADLNKLKLGERVFLAGIIFENGIPREVINEGIVSSFDENIINTNIREGTKIKGSPLFDIEGNVLGLNYVTSEGKVISIPNSRIKEFVGI
ncbi:MAG: serine protease [Patescibacteria group bacterium]